MSKELIVYFLSVVTCLGVPVLIFLIHSKSKVELKLIRGFIDRDILEQVHDYREEKLSQNKEIKNFLVSLENEVILNKNEDIEKRVAKLISWKEKLTSFRNKSVKAICNIHENLSTEKGDYLNLFHISQYIERSDEMIAKIEELILLEKSQYHG